MQIATFSLKNLKIVNVLSLMAMIATFFSSFLGTTLLGFFFAVCVIVLQANKIKLTAMQFFGFLLLGIYMFLLYFLSNDYVVVLKNFRFWLGVVFYLIYLKVYPEDRVLSKTFFRIVCFSILLETFLINTIIPAPIFYSGHPHAVKFLFYYRPLSFGGNASMSSAALVCLYMMIEMYGNVRFGIKDKLLLFLITFLFFSGSGLMCYLLMILLKNVLGRKLKTKKGMYTIFFSLVFLLILLIIMMNLDYELFPKFSLDYYWFLLDFKIEQYNEVVDFSNAVKVFFGAQITDLLENTTGDFGWLGFVSAMGLLGLFIYFFILFSFYRKNIFRNSVYLILFIATFHYPAGMSGAGQFITAFICVSKRKRLEEGI